MAKGNLILGTAQKKLGDVVMYRRNGVQQARVRVRSIANPKTEGQALQRNYMAPVAKFYAPIAGVLERAWEGLNKAQSHNAFTKANVELARANGWYVEKGAGFTPLPYKVSKGIMDPFTFAYDNVNGGLKWYVHGLAASADPISIATLSAALVTIGYHYGDQVTFILFVGSDQSDDIRPAWFRFLLSESDTTTIDNLVPFGLDVTIANGSITIAGDVDIPVIGGAVIASRWDGKKWLRSTQYCVVSDEFLGNYTSEAARAAAIASYRGGDSVVSSDVYLNGGSGSTSTQDQSVQVNFYGFSTGEARGICKLKSVKQGFPTAGFVGVMATNAASGSSMVLQVIKGGTGADKNHLLQNDGSFAAAEDVTVLVLDYTKGGAELQQFLAENGITIA